ncbi:hypothetical protein [Thermococcus alcaliphilus]|uniref:hypothetical protein n=1 Tax=Thermococcus alcaliphilus TaxID=139207 RepID=UPI0020911321|nr:hypothetical protein [Thermococcus alcaliphilus]MCO6040533.1 hypothetical protein [Thermococcus alcaliphilus]
MNFYITLGRHKITPKEFALSIISGIVISLTILFWQIVGVIEKPLITSIKGFSESSLGFALLLIALVSAIETIKQHNNSES